MKKIFFSLLATMVAAAGFAQNSMLATLSHDGTISTFYGTTAYKDAMAKAAHGDAISLSAGQFLSANIDKNVIIRGAGMSSRNDSVYSHESTILQGAFEINIPDSLSGRLNIEGVYCTSDITYKGTLNNPLFMKCRFEKFYPNEGSMTNASFIHCRIGEGPTLSDNSNACMINCLVWWPYNLNTTGSTFEFDNCVVKFPDNNSRGGNVINSYYKNCMIMIDDYAGIDMKDNCIPYSCTAVNCVGCSSNSSDWWYNNIFYHMGSKNSTNVTVGQPSDVFKTGGFTYMDNEMYELTDEAKTKYLGTDGTQIGIYGGNLPYEEDPTTPQITKCNVAAKSTADGKLSVDIEVKAAEY